MPDDRKPHSTQNVPPGIVQRADWWLCGQLLAEPAVLLRELLDEHRSLVEQLEALRITLDTAYRYYPKNTPMSDSMFDALASLSNPAKEPNDV